MDILRLPRIDGATSDERVRQLTNYIFQLVEQLQAELGKQDSKFQIGEYTIEAKDGHLTVY